MTADQWATPRASTRRGLLAVIVIVAATLRLWYGWAWSDPSRFWDEGYALENVRSILVSETLRPAKAYYPSPVFNLPPTLVIGATASRVDRADERLFDPASGKFGPWAYRICRGLQALAGVLAVVALYALGSSLFGPREGLLAAAVLAVLPWHVHASGIFKPDALLTLGVLLSLLAAVRFFERPDRWRALVLGLAVALAASAKLTGVLVAVPVAGCGLWLWRRDPRRWPALLAAGALSFLVFVAANPYWRAYPRFVQGLQRDYAMRAAWAGMTRWEVPERFLGLLTGPTGFGLLAGTAAVAGYAWLLTRQARRAQDGPARRAGLLAVLAFPPLYVAIYALQTAYFKANNFLPALPVFALGLAAGIVALARRLRRPAVVSGLVLLVLGPVAWRGWIYVYRSLVPSTRDVALASAATWGSAEGRLVAVSGLPERWPRWEGANRGAARAAVVASERSHSPGSFERFDAEILQLNGPLRSCEEAVPEAHVPPLLVAPRLLALRGPPACVVRHAWRKAGSGELTLEPCRQGVRCAELPRRGRTSWISLSLWLGAAPGRSRTVPALSVGGEAAPLHVIGRRGRGLLLTSERLPWSRLSVPVRFEGSEWRRADRLRWLAWRRPHGAGHSR